jgi:hypothetical protein
MAAGISLLHEQLSREMGTDMLGPEGDRLLTLGLLDIYSHPIIDAATASAAEAGLDLPTDARQAPQAGGAKGRESRRSG